eukprot:4933990-Pyramimonas_sp.AAC.1
MPPLPLHLPELSVPPRRQLAGAPDAAARRAPAEPYRGDFTVIEWNAQAFFAADTDRRDMKARYLRSLLARSDVVMLTEAHGTPGGHAMWTPPPGCSAWWSAGATTAHAGIGIVLHDRFLSNFTEPPRWTVIWPGRAAVLSQRGRCGALDLVVAYFPTGSEVHDADLFGAVRDQLPDSPGFPDLREHLRARLSHHVAPATQALTILGGDFNWVPSAADRRATSTANATGRRDDREERHFQSLIGRPFELQEMYQSAMTCAMASSRARLDRFYCNMHLSD